MFEYAIGQKDIMTQSTYQSLPGLFISHGSPLLALQQDAVVDALKRTAYNLPKPRAIVVMSAHWQEQVLQVSTAQHPQTWHDFQGFPAELYRLRYDAPGDPQLAESIIGLLQADGFAAYADTLRPRDHGAWMPLLHLYPAADIPVIQLSLPYVFTPTLLYQLGQCLRILREQQILLIGSGSITHNLAELDWQHAAAPPSWASRFRNRVTQALRSGDYDTVLNWRQLPDALRNHPTLEHLQPLFFIMGTGYRMNIIHSSFALGALGMDIYRFD